MIFEWITSTNSWIVGALVTLIIFCMMAIGYVAGNVIGVKVGMKKMEAAAEHIAQLMKKWENRAIISFRALLLISEPPGAIAKESYKRVSQYREDKANEALALVEQTGLGKKKVEVVDDKSKEDS